MSGTPFAKPSSDTRAAAAPDVMTGAPLTWTVCVVVALAGLPASSIAVAFN